MGLNYARNLVKGKFKHESVQAQANRKGRKKGAAREEWTRRHGCAWWRTYKHNVFQMIFTTAAKEDANHLLEETCDVDHDDPFFKAISRETKKSVMKFPRQSKANVQELSYR